MPEKPATHALIIEDQMIIALEVESLLRDIGFVSFDVAATPGKPSTRRAGIGRT